MTALLSFAGWLLAGASLHDAILIAIAVLIITCPCALALAVPAVQVVAAGRLFRHGILLNSADALERLAEVDSVILDKTGTLTLPDLRASNLATIDPEIRALAERLAMSSHHPLARALAVTAIDRRPLEGAVEEAGLGVRAVVEGSEARLGSLAYCDIAQAFAEADGTSSLLAFRHGEKRAVLHIRQRLRPDAASTIARLSREGYTTQIISGDRDAVVADVASAVGVTVWSGRRSPADKIVAIEAMRAAGQRPLMVGDGLNDAPALAAAYASIAPITASALSPPRRCHLSGRGPVADRRYACDGASSAQADDSEPGFGNCLQWRRGAACDRRPRDATRRGCRHVGLVGAGDAECLASAQWRAQGRLIAPTRASCAQKSRRTAMNVLVYLVPMALGLGLTALFAFLWSVRAGQFDDMEGAAIRILADDDVPADDP